MSEITGNQLLAEGRPIKLLSGEVVHLRFTNRSMLKVEELFGNYQEFRRQISSGTRGPLFHGVNKGAWAALQHDEKWRGDFWKLVDALDQNEVLTVVHQALLDAVNDAFPPDPPKDQETPPTSPATEAGESPGPGYTPAPADDSVLATASSGT